MSIAGSLRFSEAVFEESRSAVRRGKRGVRVEPRGGTIASQCLGLASCPETEFPQLLYMFVCSVSYCLRV